MRTVSPAPAGRRIAQYLWAFLHQLLTQGTAYGQTLLSFRAEQAKPRNLLSTICSRFVEAKVLHRPVRSDGHTPRPVLVVEQGPHEVAAHVGAGGDGRTQGSNVEGEIADALQVDEVSRAVELLDGACAVLEDVDRQAIAPIQLDQGVAQALRGHDATSPPWTACCSRVGQVKDVSGTARLDARGLHGEFDQQAIAVAVLRREGYNRVSIVGKASNGAWRAKGYRGTTEVLLTRDGKGRVSVD